MDVVVDRTLDLVIAVFAAFCLIGMVMVTTVEPAPSARTYSVSSPITHQASHKVYATIGRMTPVHRFSP